MDYNCQFSDSKQEATDTFKGAGVDVAKVAPLAPPQDAENREPVTPNDKGS